MDMHVPLDVKLGVDTQLVAVLADVAYCRLGAFLHHVAQVAGELQFAGALHGTDFYAKQFAAKRSPCQAVDDTDLIGIVHSIAEILHGAEVTFYHLGSDTHGFPLSGNDLFCGLALDENNQPELTPDRIAAWVEQIKKEAGI